MPQINPKIYQQLFYKWINTPVGKLRIIANTNYLIKLDWSLDTLDLSSEEIELAKNQNGILNQTNQELMEYFDGRRTEFTIPINIHGTDFQRLTWNSLSQIPFGKTISYKTQAEMIGNSKAFRAVGTANSKNPIAIIIPCHRVISNDGKLSGYAGGSDVKRWLLNFESKINLRESKTTHYKIKKDKFSHSQIF